MIEDDEEEEEGALGWLISFADLMTLLFATFVVLYGNVTHGKVDLRMGVLAAIREAFVEVSERIPDDMEVGEIKKGNYVFKAFRGDTPSNEGPKKYLLKNDQRIAVDMDKSKVDKFLDQLSMDKKKMNLGLRSAMNVEDHERGFTIKLMGAYFFQPNDYRFNRKGRDRFLALGRELKKIDRRIVIEGHTDSEKSKGRFKNSEIGALRSATAARLLVTELGMSPLMIDTMSFAATRPIADNNTVDGRNKNRRIEIKVFY